MRYQIPKMAKPNVVHIHKLLLNKKRKKLFRGAVEGRGGDEEDEEEEEEEHDLDNKPIKWK